MSSRSEPITPSRLRILFQAPELAAAKRIVADPVTALRKAEDIGYVDGFFNRHSVDHQFCSALEWTAWLGGWRARQAELVRQREDAVRIMERL